MNSSEQFKEMETYIALLQKSILQKFSKIDGVPFQRDKWKHAEGGGGLTCVLEDGNVFEKGGVNISSVHGQLPTEMAKHFGVSPCEFAACGLSLVMHPKSPKIPTVHMNVRFFEMEHGDCWYGGGIDLTPYYPTPKDFQTFHQTLEKACNIAIPNSYKQFKEECDNYFTIKHRQEMRGIGGIFFDYLRKKPKEHFRLIQSIGNTFLPAYIPILEKYINEPYTKEDVLFQMIRRGRYIEFNLIYDRGTLFGLKTNGRIESILMSLPKYSQFPYNWSTPKESPHEEMMKYYQPNDWTSKRI